MKLTDHQQRAIDKTWNIYQELDRENYITKGGHRYSEIDDIRLDILPQVQNLVDRFLSGELTLADFKTQNDSMNKQNHVWGFRGMSGQMFFNMVYNRSEDSHITYQLENLLKQMLSPLSSIHDAVSRIRSLSEFVDNIEVDNPRQRPRKGSIPYFLSYFFQIQDHEKYPVYYKSMVDKFRAQNIWEPSGTVDEQYASFFEMNQAIQDYLQEQGYTATLWDIEHAFYVGEFISKEDSTRKQPIQTNDVLKVSVPVDREVELPVSYIPPIVSILPQLAAHNEALSKACENMGTSIVKVFESRIDTVFNMLGYETQPLGQGHGRVPDGLALSREYHYAIIYDAKVSTNGYSIGRDDRAIREYINNISYTLTKQGITKFYFLLISSKFVSDNDDAIRSLKMESNANEIILLEAETLLAMLETKLRDSSIDLGPEGLQRLFTQSGVLDMETFNRTWGNG